jgi:molybdopterin/thiamine biosynthesis adenylyltransferase
MTSIQHDILDFQKLTENWDKSSLEKIKILDTLVPQLYELVRIRNPHLPKDSINYDNEIEKILAGVPLSQFGNWIYYPWSQTMLRLLPEREFVEVRTSRNRLKITEEEQQILITKKIGIVGLSVGHAIAHVIALERVCGELHLADFDVLDLSNLNRLRTPLSNLGLNKTTIIQREIAEIDPYLKIKIWEEGIQTNNIDDFLFGLDILIEVCDSLEMKILTRIRSRQNSIPVVMDTNDRGMIDIERFDIESNRPIFHGKVNELSLLDLNGLNQNERFSILQDLVSFNDTSERLKLSVRQIGKSLVTWPQLASSVQLGAGATCDIVRRILLGEDIKSGRFYFDVESILL